MNWNEHIVSDPEVLGGKPVVRGTRLAVDFLLGLFAQGWTEAQVRENYPQLTPESLRAVFAYAADTLGDEGFYPRGAGPFSASSGRREHPPFEHPGVA